jgi:hypothetical protein
MIPPMTKPYHITPEQADALALKVSPECKYVSAYELYPESLTAIINAALDEVLGEPVAEITENILWGKDIRWLVDLPVVGTKLYAPRREK